MVITRIKNSPAARLTPATRGYIKKPLPYLKHETHYVIEVSPNK